MAEGSSGSRGSPLIKPGLTSLLFLSMFPLGLTGTPVNSGRLTIHPQRITYIYTNTFKYIEMRTARASDHRVRGQDQRKSGVK